MSAAKKQKVEGESTAGGAAADGDRKVALITGITGQDGSYLTEFLLEKGYMVHGIIRRSSSFNTGRIEHLYKDSHLEGVRLFLHYGDLSDSTNLCALMHKIKPTEVRYLLFEARDRRRRRRSVKSRRL